MVIQTWGNQKKQCLAQSPPFTIGVLDKRFTRLTSVLSRKQYTLKPLECQGCIIAVIVQQFMKILPIFASATDFQNNYGFPGIARSMNERISPVVSRSRARTNASRAS